MQSIRALATVDVFLAVLVVAFLCRCDGQTVSCFLLMCSAAAPDLDARLSVQVRNEELRRLQTIVAQQADEIRHLRQQAQRQPLQNGSASAAAMATPHVSSTSTPSSSRLAQDVQLRLPNDGGTPGDTWVSFGAGGGREDAPTPTLLQPSSSFRGSSHTASSTAAAGSAHVAASAAGTTPVEEALRVKLELGLSGSGSSLGAASSADPQRLGPLRSQSGSLAAAPSGHSASTVLPQRQQHQQALRSFPVHLTPGSSPLPAGASSGPSGPRSPGVPSSPMHSRSSSGMSAGGLGARAGSPSKHRRNATAPDGGFFEDLNPLH